MNDASRALVFAAGSLPVPRRRTAVLAGAKTVVAADGGLAHAIALGFEPDLVVGDMDSVRERDLATVPDARIDRHPRAKDDLDLELALDAARERGARRIDVVGAFGSRLDQSFAALLIASRHAREGVDVRLHGGSYEARLVPPGGQASLAMPAGTVVSLLALTEDVVVSTSGLRYRLERAPLPYGRGLGVSNEVQARQGDAPLATDTAAAGAKAASRSTNPAALAGGSDAAAATDVTIEAHRGTVAVLVAHPIGGGPKDAIWGSQRERIEAGLAGTDPDLADLIGRVAYEEVFARPDLDLRTRELLSVAMLTAMGSDRELPTHVRGALQVGASEGELRETVLHAAMFAGFPRALAAMRVVERMLKRRTQEDAVQPDRDGDEPGSP
ncbi:MAG: thiamine diphosphokinase [Trueperaceae bacterium]